LFKARIEPILLMARTQRYGGADTAFAPSVRRRIVGSRHEIIRIWADRLRFHGEVPCYAMRNAPRNFALPLEPRFEIIADIDAPSAERAVGSLGFARSSGDWRNLVIDPAVDVVSITTPNSLHKPMALAALAAGKTVW
jgi:predicted dehydrogenase